MRRSQSLTQGACVSASPEAFQYIFFMSGRLKGVPDGDLLLG